MNRSLRRSWCVFLALFSCWTLQLAVTPEVDAGQRHTCPNCRAQTNGNPDLFANYYVPGTCGGVPAAMYVAPHPVPPHVGHTFYTYQPMMPHELLYTHHRHYYRYYDNGRGMTRASVKWYNPPLRSSLMSLQNHFQIAR